MIVYLKLWLRLVVALAVVVGFFAGIAALWTWLGGPSAARAFTLVFYLGGGLLLLIALLTSGAEKRAWGADSDVFLERMLSVPEEEGRSLNPTGIFILGGLVVLALGVVFEATL